MRAILQQHNTQMFETDGSLERKMDFSASFDGMPHCSESTAYCCKMLISTNRNIGCIDKLHKLNLATLGDLYYELYLYRPDLLDRRLADILLQLEAGLNSSRFCESRAVGMLRRNVNTGIK